jgi:hypothetical protein
MRELLLLLFLSSAMSPALSAAAGKADAETVKKVESFLKRPTAELPPDRIDEFVAIDPESLPKKLQVPFKAKRLELFTLKQMAEGKKKGLIRTPDEHCEVPREAKSGDARVLLMAGYEEITGEEVGCITERTKCTEMDMLCEFSLQILVERVGKKKERSSRFFLHEKDPLMAVVAGCRSASGGNTHFFGRGGPVCSH